MLSDIREEVAYSLPSIAATTPLAVDSPKHLLQFTAEDDGEIVDVEVWHNNNKVFWAPLAGTHELPLELSPGKNSVTIYATDDQGLSVVVFTGYGETLRLEPTTTP